MTLLCSKEDNIFKITDNESTPTNEILRTLEEAFNDPDFANTGILLDLTQHTAWKQLEDIRRIADLIGKHGKKIGRRNSIVVSNALQDSLAQTFALQAELQGVPFDIFTDIKEARRWIQEET